MKTKNNDKQTCEECGKEFIPQFSLFGKTHPYCIDCLYEMGDIGEKLYKILKKENPMVFEEIRNEN